MKPVAGIDVGSTYTKAVLLDEEGNRLAQTLLKTGFDFARAAREAFERALAAAGLASDAVGYVISTGYGRSRVSFRDAGVTDLTAHARGAIFLFPDTRTVLDIGGQTMKVIRLDAAGKVQSFRLNDKCAAGTGAFLEKTAQYLGFSIEELGPLAATSKTPVPISGVCAVFAESEVINHVSSGVAPADIMQGGIESLAGRSVQLMRRVRMEPAYTAVGGILRFPSVADALRKQLTGVINVPAGELAQFTGALGAALLARRRLQIKETP